MPDNIFRTATASGAPAASTRANGPTMIPAPSVSQATNPAHGAHVDNSSTPAMIATPGLDPLTAQRPGNSHPGGWAQMSSDNGWAQRHPAGGHMQVRSQVVPAGALYIAHRRAPFLRSEDFCSKHVHNFTSGKNEPALC
jgi:hypothetical protein